MALIRALYLYTSIYGIKYTSVHIGTKVNILADKLSRLCIQEFRLLAPNSDSAMTKQRDMLLDF